MIGNPFLYRAADVKTGHMAEDRNFVNLFGVSALNLLKNKIQGLWDMPLLLISAPGGGKSSMMRIFSPRSLKYIQETASISGDKKALALTMEELGAFKDGKPYALGIWIKMSDEYQIFQEFENSILNGLFCSLLNSRIILSFFIGICDLNELFVHKDLERISLTLNSSVSNITENSWKKWGDKNGKHFYEKMAELEANLCEMIDDPFWSGTYSDIVHSGLWSVELLANLEISIDDTPQPIKPLIMLDDAHELAESQLKFLFNMLTSRQIELPFWVSIRKQALGLEELFSDRLGKGAENGRDYQFVDFEKSKRDFRKRVLEISTLRVQSAASQIGGLSQTFVDFLSDEREELFLQNFDRSVAKDIKNKVLAAAGKDLIRFQGLIDEIEEQKSEPHDLCRRYRMLNILIKREIGKAQRKFSFESIPIETLNKHENKKAIVDSAELFLAKEYKLPYYFGAHRLISLASFNVQQFLRIAGALFEEIMMAIRLDRDKDSFLSPETQHYILSKVANEFFKEIPSMVIYGSKVFRLIRAIGNMCKEETYRPTAPYAPGVTGTALTMYEFEHLKKEANEGVESSRNLYQTIQSAIAHNILEPEPNLRCKGKEYLVLYLNRLLCISFKLPLQKGGFREKPLKAFFNWINQSVTVPNNGQKALW